MTVTFFRASSLVRELGLLASEWKTTHWNTLSDLRKTLKLTAIFQTAVSE